MLTCVVGAYDLSAGEVLTREYEAEFRTDEGALVGFERKSDNIRPETEVKGVFP